MFSLSTTSSAQDTACAGIRLEIKHLKGIICVSSLGLSQPKLLPRCCEKIVLLTFFFFFLLGIKRSFSTSAQGEMRQPGFGRASKALLTASAQCRAVDLPVTCAGVCCLLVSFVVSVFELEADCIYRFTSAGTRYALSLGS